MSRKFARVSSFRIALAFIVATILVGATPVHAQQTPATPPPPDQQAPAQQQPAAQQPADQSSSQEATPEEIGPLRKPKAPEFNKWTFNVGGGASLTNGTTRTYVRSGGLIAAAGVGPQLQQVFRPALRFPIRQSALAHFRPRTGADHGRHQSCLLGHARSHH